MVLDEVAPLLEKSSIPQIIQLAAVLRFLGAGSFQGVCANDLNISMGRTTFSKILWKVLNALEDQICPIWIKTEMQQQRTSASKTHFFVNFGIPGVIGCVDGTLIKLVKPPTNSPLYYSRKGYFAINAMIVCDYEMRILAVDASKPGSCHDSFVWKLSDIRADYAHKYQNGTRNLWLLGDSGYGLAPYLITPYKSPEYGSMQHKFNQRHSSARNVVERTIGVLKSRFRCLQTALHYKPIKVVTIINVCCALNNICKDFNVEIDEDIIPIEEEENESESVQENEDDYRNEAVTIRDNIARSIR